MSHHVIYEIITLFTSMLAYATYDRFCGGGVLWKATYPGRPIYYLLPVVLLGAVCHDQTTVWYAAFLLWRAPSWHVGGGAEDAAGFTSLKLLRVVLARHMLFTVLPVLWLAYKHQLTSDALLVALAAPVFFTAIAVVVGYEKLRGKDVTAAAEWSRGAALGALIWSCTAALGHV